MKPNLHPRVVIVAMVLLGLCGCSGLVSRQAAAGVHARFAYSEHGGLRVLEVAARGPAARAGLKSGDYVVRIDEHWVNDLSAKEVVTSLRGPANSRVRLTIRRDTQTQVLEVRRVPYSSRASRNNIQGQ